MFFLRPPVCVFEQEWRPHRTAWLGRRRGQCLTEGPKVPSTRWGRDGDGSSCTTGKRERKKTFERNLNHPRTSKNVWDPPENSSVLHFSCPGEYLSKVKALHCYCLSCSKLFDRRQAHSENVRVLTFFCFFSRELQSQPSTSAKKVVHPSCCSWPILGQNQRMELLSMGRWPKSLILTYIVLPQVLTSVEMPHAVVFWRFLGGLPVRVCDNFPHLTGFSTKRNTSRTLNPFCANKIVKITSYPVSSLTFASPCISPCEKTSL